MVDPIHVNRLNWDERAGIHARDATGDYMLDRFRAGEDALHAIEAAELGDISGKRVLHLQCHIGRDTLCLVPGGELYFADDHPSFLVLEEHVGRLVTMYDFQTPADRPLEFSNATTYTGDPTIMTHQSTREWIHL